MHEPSSSERIQRIRIGLTGLAFVFLLVLLGTAISRSGEDPPLPSRSADNIADGAEPGDPLAELGLAPGQSTSDNQAEGAAGTAPPR